MPWQLLLTFLSLDLLIQDILYKWKHTCFLLFLASFT
jgi:hypothetical protein